MSQQAFCVIGDLLNCYSVNYPFFSFLFFFFFALYKISDDTMVLGCSFKLFIYCMVTSSIELCDNVSKLIDNNS